MKRYFTITLILVLFIFVNGCAVTKTGRATAPGSTELQDFWNGLNQGIDMTQLATLARTWTKVIVPPGSSTPSPPQPECPGISRDISCSTNTVDLYISSSCIASNEIIMIAERIPDGTDIVAGSWGGSAPTYYDANRGIMVWLLARNIPQITLEGVGTEVTQLIPSKISYSYSGTPSSEFKGKFAIETSDTEIPIGGESIC